ncbi:leaf rust 10 disease-resistance locus receptor-like protein kinase-like 2.1 [Quercus suber]|uniref:Leaf rust 10 disease-resistance locus receptor-like protein kinase-like 2.1 n=1 Tax=Quercus suber TaxID=58331 RepID=A0AAW0JCC6_QUESU
MEAHHLALSSLITLSFFLAILPPSYCTDDARFVDCSRPYECGRIKNLSYPFWGELEFLILNINQSQNNTTIARLDLWAGSCPQAYGNTVLNYSIFDYATTVLNITLFYDCPPQLGSDANNNAYFLNESLAKIHILEPAKCRGKIRVPISRTAIIDESAGVVPALHEALNQGFEVNYDALRVACSGCVESGGNCGSNVTHQFVCFCRDGERSYNCPGKDNPKGITI